MTRTQAQRRSGQSVRLRPPLILVAVALIAVGMESSAGIAGAASATVPTASPAASASPPGQPSLGPNVVIFNPTMPESQIQATVDSIAAQQVSNQFGPQRYALLFQPGTYGTPADPLIFQVGYYTEVAGLGSSPQDVIVNGTVNVYNQCFPSPPGTSNCTALDNFWRSLSNLTINVTGGSGCRTATEFWAVSQAAPMRRVNLAGKLSLMDYCTAGPQFASGGFIADSAFSGSTVVNGSQQQFIVRNTSLDGWSNAVWNQVFSGDPGAPAQSFSPGDPGPTPPYTTLPTSPVTEEKPFLYTDAKGNYNVFVPAVQTDTAGPSWATASTPGRSIPIQRFFIADPHDSVAKINAALARGQDLILTPGIYRLDRTIEVARPDTVVLGLGFPTLIPQHGIVSMRADSVPGVKLSGMIFDAGPVNSPVLLQVGDCPDSHAKSDANRQCRPAGAATASSTSQANPTLVQDVFFRIGGAEAGKATTSLVVNTSKAILDDIWAWRADHGTGVGWDQNTADTGLVVNGNHVTAYGLFVEHYQKYEVIWSGQEGEDIFFQNEMPYDPPTQTAWMASPITNGYPAFLVTQNVTSFQSYGTGSYCFFNQGLPIHATTAFEVPNSPGVQLHDLLTRFLNGSGGIDSVVDLKGAPVNQPQPGPSDVVSYPPGV